MAGAAKKHKLSDQSIYAWRKHSGELGPADVKRVRRFESENTRLKRLLAERDLDMAVLKGVNAKNSAVSLLSSKFLMDIHERQSGAQMATRVQFKAKVIAAYEEAGMLVAAVARRCDLSDNLLHQWRRGRGMGQPVTALG